MSQNSQDAAQVLRSIWGQDVQQMAELDEECSPNKACRNMKDITFDGFGEEGEDMQSAWKAKLAREGKLNTSPGTIRDLVLGSSN
ncbi:MAG: hypothetical protein WCH38_08480 [Actinomycetota bacterium]